MAPEIHAHQKAADAAFFEDWSEWASLDDLPRADRPHGYFRARPAAHNRYWCVLRRRIDWMGGHGFELSLPNIAPIADMMRRLPGARQHPGLSWQHRQMHSGLEGTWFVPAQHWRELRAALPTIKARVLVWIAQANSEQRAK